MVVVVAVVDMDIFRFLLLIAAIFLDLLDSFGSKVSCASHTQLNKSLSDKKVIEEQSKFFLVLDFFGSVAKKLSRFFKRTDGVLP